jgi:hypothetical protein
MDGLTPTPKQPADYYRCEAARLRRLASEATTPAVKQHLSEQAAQLDRLAERLEDVWTPGSVTVLLNKAPALNNISTLICNARRGHRAQPGSDDDDDPQPAADCRTALQPSERGKASVRWNSCSPLVGKRCDTRRALRSVSRVTTVNRSGA